MKDKYSKVSIYYDRNCGFCKRSVARIVKYGLVKTFHVGPAQEDAEVLSIMDKHDSWVVKNSQGEFFTTFQAGVEIAKCSPWMKFLVPLSKPRSMRRFGEWTYRKIANNRRRLNF